MTGADYLIILLLQEELNRLMTKAEIVGEKLKLMASVEQAKFDNLTESLKRTEHGMRTEIDADALSNASFSALDGDLFEASQTLEKLIKANANGK